MWQWISNYLSQYMDRLKGGDTKQSATGSTADNAAAGAKNTGWGSMAQDLTKGNYASAAGNAMQMGTEAQQNQQQQRNQQAGQSSIPQLPQNGATYQTTPGAGMTPGASAQTPYLQAMMQRYFGG